MMERHLLAALLVLLALAPSLSAQGLPDFPEVPTPGITYDLEIPAPKTVLAAPQGSRHARPDEIVRYFEQVAAASERVQVFVHGHTPEGRPLIHAIVASKDRLARLPELQREQLRLFKEPEGFSESLPSDRPLVLWMGYGVHGNESSAHEAAMLCLYHLAAAKGPAIDELLKHCIVLVVPNLNPDGHARFVDWVNSQRGVVPNDDPEDREHNAPWPGGRTNHYLFDLNRDWIPAAQMESEARLALWHSWRPALQTDYHEMGGQNTYFFQPGIEGRDHPMIPARVRDLTLSLARHHASALDAVGQSYYAQESFDDFYLGKGSSYPDILGGVGILFEQGSSRGLLSRTRNGPLPYRTTIRNQIVTTLSTLRGAVELREGLYAHQRTMALEKGGPQFEKAAYRLPFAGQTPRVLALGELLLRHHIRVLESKDGLIVPLAQEKHAFIRSLFEPMTRFTVQSFYDVSTWNLPQAYGVEALFERDSDVAAAEAFNPAAHRGGRLHSGAPAQGWIIPWDGQGSYRALTQLWADGLLVKGLGRSMELQNGVRVPSGSLWIPAAQSARTLPQIGARLKELADRMALDIYPIETAWTDRGLDLGSPRHLTLEAPKVAILAGEGFDAYRVGELWHHCDIHLQQRVSLIDPARIDRQLLKAYDTVFLPSGLSAGLSKGQSEALLDFVEGGGHLIAIGTATETLVRAELSRLEVETPAIGPSEADPEANPSRNVSHGIAGIFLQAELSRSHPLAFGLESSLPVFRLGTARLKVDRAAGATVVARYSKDPVLSGYCSAERAASLAGSPSIAVERRGAGRILHFMEPPSFRGLTLGSARLIANALAFRAGL